MNESGPEFAHILEPGEELQHAAPAGSAMLAVTDRRIAVIADGRTALDVAIDGLRRIQFDIEKDRPATLVIVPEHATHVPQVLAVRPVEYEAVAAALVTIGQRLADGQPAGNRPDPSTDTPPNGDEMPRS